MGPLAGVFYGWWIVAACGGVVLVANGTLWYGFSVLFDPIVKEFGWSTMATAAAFSLRSEVSAFGAPITGWLADRVGSRITMILGVLVTAVGFYWFAHVDSLLSFYGAFSVIAIAATATGNQVATVAISWWFTKKRSRALAFLTVGAGFSGLTVPFFAMQVDQLGWRQSLLIWAVVIVVVCVPLCMVVRDKPEKYGLLPDGAKPDEASRIDGVGANPALNIQREPSITVKQALKNRTFWLLAIGMLLHALGSGPAVALLVPGLIKVDIDPSTAALALAAIPIVSLPGRIAAGWLGDTVDKRKLMAVCLFVEGAGILVLAATTTPLVLAAAVLLFSPAFGGTIPLRPALQAEHFGLQSIGTIQGLMNTVTTFGGFVGPILVGALVDLTGTYQVGFAIVGLATLAGTPLVLMIPRQAANRAPAALAPSTH